MDKLYPWALIKKEKNDMATGYEKYPSGYDGQIDRYMMNVVLLCEAMTQQQVQVRSMMAPDSYSRDNEYEFRFMKDGVSVTVRLPQVKREMVPSEIVAREVVAQLRGHWDNSVLKNVGGVLGGLAGREPDPSSYYEKEMKKRVGHQKNAPAKLTSGTKNTGSPKKIDVPKIDIPKYKPPEYQVELQKRLDAWLS